MLQIPLSAVPTQTLAVILNRQPAEIELRQNGDNLYFSLLLNQVPIVTTRICRDIQLLLVDARYRGFRGDFMFIDLQGTSDPNYRGLGTRFLLVYLTPDEVP